MSQTYFVKGLIGKVLAYGGLQIRTSLPHGLQPTNERRAESKLAYAMPSKEEEDKVKSLRTSFFKPHFVRRQKIYTFVCF